MPRTFKRLRAPWGTRYHTRLAPSKGRPSHQRPPDAQRQSPRKRAFRVCPPSLQAHLREGRRARRDPQARVLREADPGAQAQGRRRGEAPGPPHLARRDQAPAPVLIHGSCAVPGSRPRLARRRLFCFSESQSRIPNPMLKTRLADDMKTAMKAGDKATLGVIRLVNAAIKQREVDERIELDDAQVTAVLEKMVKQRRDSVSQYEAAAREDLAAIERAEIEVIQRYLPE